MVISAVTIPIHVDTGRLVLRSFTALDVAQRYLYWLSDPVIVRYLELSVGATITNLEKYVASVMVDDGVVFAVTQGAVCSDIGSVNLEPINTRNNHAEIGINVGVRDCWGEGLSLESIRALSRFAFGQLGFSKFYAGACRSVAASIRAFEEGSLNSKMAGRMS